MKDLLRKQMAKAMRFDRRFVRLDDAGAIAFAALQARLHTRSSQLDSIISPAFAIGPATRVAQTPWSLSSSNQGINVVMSEAFAVPFPSTFVCNVGSRVAMLYGLEVLADNVRYRYI